MDVTTRFAEQIAEECLLWEEFSKRWLKGVILPDMLTAAGIMAKIMNATKSKPFRGVVLHAFLGSVRGLRGVLPSTISRIEATLDSHWKNGETEARYDFRHLTASSMELQDRARDLLRAIEQVQNRADELRSREGSGLLGLNNDTILNEMTRRINHAATLFEAGISNAVDECISSIINLQQRKKQFRLAEQSAQFIEHIALGSGTYSAEEQHGLEAATSMQRDIAADVKQWLSGIKRVYLLTGEPGTGKTRNVRGLCQYLHSERPPTARLGGSFFLDPGDKHLDSLQFAILSLSYQAAPQNRSIIVDDIRGYLYRGEEKQLRHEAIERLRRSLSAASSRAQTPTVLVLDGIDQCKETHEIPGLLRRLLAFVRECPWLFLFLAARPRPNVMAALTHPSAAELVHHNSLDDDIDIWKEDPNSYLVHTVPRISAYTDYIHSHPDFLERLIKMPKGDIRFAKLAARYLEAEQNRPYVRIDHLASMAESESPLKALYMEQLKSVTSLSSPFRRRCLQALMRFIAYTECVLTPDAISSYAHEISADDIVCMVDDLRAVLTINHNCEIVPHDASFPKFLRECRREGRLKLPFRLRGNRSFHAASICLAAISTASPIATIPWLLPPPDLLPDDSRFLPATPFLSLWPWYLSESMSMAHPELIIQLHAFVPSLPLAMYAWVTGPDEMHHAAGIVARYLAAPLVDPGSEYTDHISNGMVSSRKRILSDFYAFACYVQLRRDRRGQRISATDVIEAIAQGCQDVIVSLNTGLHFSANLTFTSSLKEVSYDGEVSIEPDSLRRYYDITEDFLTRLRGEVQVGDELSTLGLLEGTFRLDRWT
ncbi:AAA-16 domain-containing protein [Phanerochaete sordida]|uniref:AAA-16 domain-containing protein n=1 Tax=Phanerochaete sordida TaxID=48140 RepID=A0A9P3GNV6_9APHY|nr:AAA-16 domain-containing protein [Phanerochaete sordida]